MKPKEIELILIEGLFHTPETRIDFYLSKAKENNCKPFNFCLALFEAYKRLNKYVNSYEPNTWAESKDGTKEPIKRTINLLHFTNGLFKGTLDDENITDLLSGLTELTKQVKDEITKTAELSNKQKGKQKASITGFQSSLTEEQIQSLFDQLKGKYIDINTNPDHFKAMFKNESLPVLFKSVTWIDPPVLLAYLIYKLKKHKKIRSSNHWQITSYCFYPKCNYRQLADGFQNTKSGNPKESELIDAILKSIYAPLQ